jgi:uncharacterized RDD family membrane protein YckC
MTAAIAGAAGRRAGLFTRAAASVIDALILAAAIHMLIWFLEVDARVLRRFGQPRHLGTIVLVAAPFIIAVYQVFFWRLRGQTPGKWLLGIQVVALGGGPVGVGRALVRLLGYLFSALPVYIGFLWILGRQRRGFHDHLAKTEVVYARRPAPNQPAPSEMPAVPRRFLHA